MGEALASPASPEDSAPRVPYTVPAVEPPAADPSAAVRLTADDKEGFSVVSGDGNYKLRWGAVFNVRGGLTAQSGGEVTPGFQIALARVVLQGHVFRPWIKYFLLSEFAGASPALLDAEFTLAPIDELQLHVGQFRTQVSRGFLMPLHLLQLPELSLAGAYFRAGRDIGANLQGFLADGKLEYYAGLFNGNGIGTLTNDNGELMALGRLVYNPFGALPYDETLARAAGPARLALGVNGYHNRASRTRPIVDLDTGLLGAEPLPDVERSVLGVDLHLRIGPFTTLAEWFFDWRSPADAPEQRGTGGYVQAGYFLVPGALELALRFNLVASDLENRGLDGWRRYEGGLTWYAHGNNVKLQARYGYDDVDDGMMGLPAARSGHLATLQGQLWF